MKILVKDYPNLKILLVGDGPLRKKIEDLIDRLDLRNNITIIKDIANEKLPQIYQTSDIFVLPSLNEGVPKTLLEAMTCGKPVVISELPHLNDLIQNCGFMFPKQDVHAFAENILKLIKDKETTKTFGLNARKKIIQDHSWENTVKKTVELYEEIAVQ
jgi:glycosyltransferase involved in cell wall biosynthesis